MLSRANKRTAKVRKKVFLEKQNYNTERFPKQFNRTKSSCNVCFLSRRNIKGQQANFV